MKNPDTIPDPSLVIDIVQLHEYISSSLSYCSEMVDRHAHSIDILPIIRRLASGDVVTGKKYGDINPTEQLIAEELLRWQQIHAQAVEAGFDSFPRIKKLIDETCENAARICNSNWILLSEELSLMMYEK